MTSRRPEPTCAEVEQACVQGRLITRGPLNDTYEAELRGRRVFVRHRTTDDPEYGQTFAAERHVAPLLDGALRIPRVIQVVPDAGGRERYAVFEFVPGTPPDWTSRPVLRELADALLRVHRIAGSGFGSVGAAPQRRPAAALLADLIRAEAHRLPDGPERDRLGGSTVESAAHCFRGELPTLCHGDVHAGNFRTDRAGRFWVLDWEAARYRVPAADFNQLHDHWLSGGGSASSWSGTSNGPAATRWSSPARSGCCGCCGTCAPTTSTHSCAANRPPRTAATWTRRCGSAAQPAERPGSVRK